jgi:hypothetical protein
MFQARGTGRTSPLGGRWREPAPERWLRPRLLLEVANRPLRACIGVRGRRAALLQVVERFPRLRELLAIGGHGSLCFRGAIRGEGGDDTIARIPVARYPPLPWDSARRGHD